MKDDPKIKLRTSIIIVIFLISIAAMVMFFWKPHRSTPEEAAKAYLKWITADCTIKDIQPAEPMGTFVRCTIDSIDKYNWRYSNSGRSDGANTHFFDVKKSFLGWYVAADNSGP